MEGMPFLGCNTWSPPSVTQFIQSCFFEQASTATPTVVQTSLHPPPTQPTYPANYSNKHKLATPSLSFSNNTTFSNNTSPSPQPCLCHTIQVKNKPYTDYTTQPEAINTTKEFNIEDMLIKIEA
jgi:hypothetical protein